jgi:uncharacterized protein (TIGR02147 family)
MPNIFTYTDYREFIADYYKERKAEFPAFSFQILANQAGFPNKGFVYNVMKGRKNLSRASAKKLSKAMQLSLAEAEYFEKLVSLNQAKNHEEKTFYFSQLCSIRANRPGATRIRQILRDQYQFYSQWYISAIRSLIDMHPIRDDYSSYSWLAKNVYPAIKPFAAKKAVQLLENLGMIRKKRDGTFEVTEKTITAGSEVIRLGLHEFQLQTMQLAAKALKRLPKESRHVSGLTLGISRTTYEEICKEIEEFQVKLLAMAEQDKDADNAFQLNFHLFPLTNVDGSSARI